MKIIIVHVIHKTGESHYITEIPVTVKSRWQIIAINPAWIKETDILYSSFEKANYGDLSQFSYVEFDFFIVKRNKELKENPAKLEADRLLKGKYQTSKLKVKKQTNYE